MGFDAWRKPRPDKIVWALAFALFAVAAGVEVIGATAGWTALMARTYYATGVAMVVVFLAAGQMFLLFPAQMKRFGFGLTLLISALWISLVVGAPVDQARLATDGWNAIERGPELRMLGVLLNILGTLIIVLGSGWTVMRFWRTKSHRNRMVGCLLILIGTLMVASGGSLQRLGNDAYLYVAMAAGIATIFAGVLFARTPDGARVLTLGRVRSTGQTAVAAADRPRGADANDVPGFPAVEPLAFVEMLLNQNDVTIDRLCSEWSVPRESGAQMSRADARRAWRLRGRLSVGGIERFDGHSLPARRQVAVLYHEVLTWDRTGRDDITEIVGSGDPVGLVRRGDQG